MEKMEKMEMNEIEKEADKIIKKMENSNFEVNTHFLFLIILNFILFILIATLYIYIKKIIFYDLFTALNIISVLLITVPCAFAMTLISIIFDINVIAKIILYISKDEKYKLAKKIMRNYKKKVKEEEKNKEIKNKEKEKILVYKFKEYIKDLKD